MRYLALSLSLAFLLPASLAARQPAPEPPPPTFSEDVTVREASVVVDLPDSLERRALRPADIEVLEDGERRPVTRVEPFPERSDVVVYFDEPLSRGQTRFESALALARQAAGLSRLGAVEVVAAGPVPAVLLTASDDTARVSAVLGEAAARYRREAGGPPRGSDRAAAHRQLDRLVLYLTARTQSAPHLLFYVADGSDDTALAGLFEETGKTLASYGWTVVGLAIAGEPAGEPRGQLNDLNRVIATTSVGSDAPNPALAHPKASDLQYDQVLDVFTRSGSASLRSLAQPTAGTAIGVEKQLPSFFRRVPARRRVWYVPAAADGKAHGLAVRLAPGGVTLRGQTQARSSTPPGLAEARLRALLAGDRQEGKLVLKAGWAPGGHSALALELPPSGEATVVGPLRLSLAYETPAGITFHHELVEKGLVAEGAWRRTVPASLPAGTRRVALVLEDLGRESWATAALPVS
jgi:hypothetical protein